jgi:hypothetical protein
MIVQKDYIEARGQGDREWVNFEKLPDPGFHLKLVSVVPAINA